MTPAMTCEEKESGKLDGNIYCTSKVGMNMYISIFRQMSKFLVIFNNTVLSVPSKCIETNNVEIRLRKFTKKNPHTHESSHLGHMSNKWIMLKRTFFSGAAYK